MFNPIQLMFKMHKLSAAEGFVICSVLCLKI